MSNKSETSTGSGGIGFFGLLGILFIALKLMGYIDWSWLWVLAPIWGGFAFAFLVLTVMIVAAAFSENRRKWK